MKIFMATILLYSSQCLLTEMNHGARLYDSGIGYVGLFTGYGNELRGNWDGTIEKGKVLSKITSIILIYVIFGVMKLRRKNLKWIQGGTSMELERKFIGKGRVGQST